jgi:uncharacterized protein with GYD domain
MSEKSVKNSLALGKREEAVAVNVDKHGVLTYYLYILPTDFELITPAERGHHPSRIKNNRNEFSRMGIDFNVAYITEAVAVS